MNTNPTHCSKFNVRGSGFKDPLRGTSIFHPPSSTIVLLLLLATTSSALATVRYVNLNNPNPAPPYTNWATAATDIQSAVDAAVAGDAILVTNGVYARGSRVNPSGVTNRVAVTKPLVLSSVNGPDVTVIDGGGLVRCAYLTNNAVMVGFSLTNGWTHDTGGGVYCESTDAVLTNCVLTGNSAWARECGGGGAYGGTLNNCTLTGNSALDGDGGGAYFCTLNNCVLTGNSAAYYDGGGAGSCTLNNCTLTGNSAPDGYGGGADGSMLNNCTLTGNSAPYGSGGGAYDSTLNNCIVYFNSAPLDYSNYDPSSTFNYCCTTPMPRCGVGNITADPYLASASHLSAESPCIGAGSSAYASGTDIDGDPWNNPPSIGCDEYHAGAVTGPLTVSLTSLTNCVRGYPVGLTAFIQGRTDLSVWDFGDGYVAVNQPYKSHSWTTLGDYVVALWAFNDSYPEGVSATVIVHVEPGLHYVAANSGSPIAPYTSWATAATNIQDAVDAAPPGGTVFVTNGVYAAGGRITSSLGDGTTNRVAVDKPLTVRSVNGPEVTFIQGQMPGASGSNTRCVYLTNAATLVGFTLTNGVAYYLGGGAYCESTSAVLSNCVLTGNSALNDYGGGSYGGTLNDCTLAGNAAGCEGGGSFYSTLNNCTLTGNAAPYGYGGGAYNSTLTNCVLTGNSANEGGGAYESTLNNCTLTGNSAPYGYGGGASGSVLNNCVLTGNSAPDGYGGGVELSTLNNCTLSGNSASDDGGGADGSMLINCTLTGNSAPYGSGGGANEGGLDNCTLIGNSASYGGGADGSMLSNCTLTGNSAGIGGGTCSGTLNNCTLIENSATNYCGGAFYSTLNNCIVYFNSAPSGGNYIQDQSTLLNYCCTTPLPTNGIGNITNAPLFVDEANGNLRLQSNSPCINSGDNTFVDFGSTDLDGNPRIVGGTVDIGAYEYQAPTSIISYAWLQQYGLPTDGSVDCADLDGTGMNNWQKWIAGLNPTNAMSVLKMLPLAATNTPLGMVVSWQSVSGITYFLQRSTNLAAQPAFTTIQSNIVGQAGTTSYTDTNAVGSGPFFYRVGVGL